MEIRLVKNEEVDKIISFLNTDWKEGHALAKSRALLDFQHLEGDHYNFFGAFEGEEMVGIVGYIPVWRFDENLRSENDLWGAIWKIRGGGKGSHCGGLELHDAITDNLRPATFGGIGESLICRKIKKYIYNFKQGVLNHYYIANRSMKTFSIAVNPLICRTEHEYPKGWTINQEIRPSLLPIDAVVGCYTPKKTITYLLNRYEYHPIYKYIFWGIFHDEELVNIWVLRRITVGQSSILRIVDVLGDLSRLPDLTESIQKIIFDESCEYVDLLNFGISELIFANIGFSTLDLDSTNTIIPNYFEPFEQTNIKITTSYLSDKPYVIFKGDSDQDRPNIL